ncbi:IS66 family transposase [Endozoicomonas montiporae]|uniref:IS66 family transposase n=1 Tax=Endozoicomonas montiporae TaxID=1027273 RepID=UPI0006909CDF|nr:transposase [Endozoicomonas montiporae]
MISIPATDQSPNLLKFIAQQQEQIAQQQEQIVQLKEQAVILQTRIEALENEIIRLKKLNPKPDIKPNTKPPPPDDDPSGSTSCLDENADDKESEDGESYSRKSEVERPDDTTRRQRSRPDSPPVSEEHCLSPDDIPEGSVRHGRESFTVQELEIKAKSVRYWLEQWLTPEGKTISGRPPDSLHGHHFGSQLQAFILLQHYGCAVTQPQLLELLWDAGISISAGELSNLLTKGHDDFHTEKDELLATGIRCSHYLQTDDTGARHKGQNGYCTVVVNELFTWFGTTGSKSRENFLTLLHRPWPVYVLNRHGLDYLEKHGLSKKWLRLLEQYSEVHFLGPKAWEDFMDDIGFKERPGLRRSISEGMLYGSLIHHGFDRHMVTFSDGARQFDVFDHAQCWLHAARPLEKVIPVNEQQANAQYWCLSRFWDIYRDLKAFKAEPSEAKANLIRQGFDSLVHTQTGFTGLQDALGGLEVIKKELLLVLDDPSLPLHNNLSESQIREHVKRRKISGGTRSDAGRQCRDTFASLKKTCRQHGLSFWDYLKDRLNGTGKFPRLANVVEYVSCWLPCGQCRNF